MDYHNENAKPYYKWLAPRNMKIPGQGSQYAEIIRQNYIHQIPTVQRIIDSATIRALKEEE